MARLDRTYTASDIIRFWANNLDKSEQEDVKGFFAFLAATESFRADAIINLVGSVIGLVPLLGDAIDIATEWYLIGQELATIGEQRKVAKRLVRDAGIRRKDLVGLFRDL